MGDNDEAAGRARGPLRTRRGAWLAVAVAIFLVFGAVTVVGDLTTTHAASFGSQQAAESKSMSIASTLNLVIRQEADLVSGVQAFFVANPDATQAQFLQWVNAIDAFAGHPELEALAETTIVLPSQLSQFAARTAADGAPTPGTAAPISISPSSDRPFYCLRAVYATRPPEPSGRRSVDAKAPVVPAFYDLCQTTDGRWLLAARDSGTTSFLPYGTGSSRGLGVGTAVYRDGTVPATVAGRRAAFIGWVGEELDPHVALSTALVGHPHTAVELQYGKGKSAVSFTAGTASPGSQSLTANLHDGWYVRTSSQVTGSSLTSGAPLVGLVTGLAISLLIALLVYLLGTGRSRALEMVEASTAQLRHQSLHDPLTGLPNRALIIDRIGQMTARSKRDGVRMAALFLDLDNFKDINDTLGHAAGDELLVEVGNRLSGVLRGEDTVGRLGGDEFVVVVEGAALADGLQALADRILDALSSPYFIEGSESPQWVTVSVGMAEGPRETPEELLRDADIALYSAKASGKHHAMVFSPEMQEELDRRRRLEVDLRLAVDAGQFVLRYVPTADLATRQATGIEAQLTWPHPTLGPVPAASFRPVLDSTGLIVPVGRWMLRQACRDGVAWHRFGQALTVSVDVSRTQFEDEGFVDVVEGALGASGFEPGSLIISLAERSLSGDGPATIGRLRQLKALGVRIALDEFGSGYSSLTFLQRYPIDILKIDRSLVLETVGDQASGDLADTLGQLGRVFGVDIMIESVPGETDREPPTGGLGSPVTTSRG